MIAPQHMNQTKPLRMHSEVGCASIFVYAQVETLCSAKFSIMKTWIHFCFISLTN